MADHEGFAVEAEKLGAIETSESIVQRDVTASHSKEDEGALVWTQVMAIIPLSAAIYSLCYLDRPNIFY